jgi:hypothetical protein
MDDLDLGAADELVCQLFEIHGMCKDITWVFHQPSTRETRRRKLKIYLVSYGKLKFNQCFRYDKQCLHPVEWHMIIVCKDHIYSCETNVNPIGEYIYQMNIINPLNPRQALVRGVWAPTIYTAYRKLQYRGQLPIRLLALDTILYNDAIQNEMADYFLVYSEPTEQVIHWYMEMYPKQQKFDRLESQEILELFSHTTE